MVKKKVCILGAFAVGKTSLVRSFVEGIFTEKYLTTVGVKIDKKSVNVDGTPMDMMVWDIAGEDDFSTIPTSFLRGASGFMLVVDQTRPATLEVALKLRETVHELVGDVPFLLLLSKSDLHEERELERDLVALETGFDVRSTSAKDGTGIEEAFLDLARMMVAAPSPARRREPDPPVVAATLASHLSMMPRLDESTAMQAMSELDLLSLVRVSRDTFVRCGTAPEWVRDLYPEAMTDQLLTPTRRFAFLEHFVSDAEQVWSGKRAARVDSGVWAERRKSDDEWGLEASALRINGQDFLILRYLRTEYSERHAILQRARENLLTQEFLEEEVQRRTTDVRNRENEIALRLITAAELRDDNTGAHIRRIGQIAGILGNALGWSAQLTDDLRAAAPMHDIGKVGIPDRILLSPSPLSPEEWEVLKTHTVIGARVLEGSSVPVLQMAREIALSHHEWWDGTGYPHGLAGEEIPESARIVAVADVFDALVHDRPYKVALSDDEAVSLISAASGTHFEPRIVDCFLSSFRQIAEVKLQITSEYVGPETLPVPSA